jgi:hypothetical protein
MFLGFLKNFIFAFFLSFPSYIILERSIYTGQFPFLFQFYKTNFGKFAHFFTPIYCVEDSKCYAKNKVPIFERITIQKITDECQEKKVFFLKLGFVSSWP